jgi:CheY-like chemotaxis protein
MDVQMPEMDGYEATRRIRALDVPGAKKIPIVAMTANVFREDVEKCLKAGMDDHLGKPLDFDEVLEKLRKYLSLHHHNEKCL